jgi:hypothetical protein
LALGATACAGATRSKTAALKAMATSSFLSMGTTSGGVSRMLAGHPGVSRVRGAAFVHYAIAEQCGIALRESFSAIRSLLTF